MQGLFVGLPMLLQAVLPEGGIAVCRHQLFEKGRTDDEVRDVLERVV